MADQLRRSAESIVLNIAEGAGHYSPGRKIYHYQLARGSAGEWHRRTHTSLSSQALRNDRVVAQVRQHGLGNADRPHPLARDPAVPPAFPAPCRPPFVARPSSPALRRPPFVARLSSPALRRPPFVAHRSRRPPLGFWCAFLGCAGPVRCGQPPASQVMHGSARLIDAGFPIPAHPRNPPQKPAPETTPGDVSLS
jgi:hypothetical protein